MQTIHEILGHTCNLITGPTREITLSCLAFVKVYLTVMPTPVIGPTLPKVVRIHVYHIFKFNKKQISLQLILFSLLKVEALSKMTDDCKRHFRQKVRDILVKMVRKFGIENITNMVPNSDETMYKRLKNIRKIETRKQKVKEEKNKDEDSDEEFNLKRMPKRLFFMNY